MAAKPPDRFALQNKLISTTRIRDEAVTIVGSGAVGRQIALQLVALGISKLTIIDPAVIEAGDVTSAGFRLDDVGHPKVDGVGDICHRTNPLLDFTGLQVRFRPGLFPGTSLFCCVDLAAYRKAIWLGVERRCRFWADIRLSGEALRVLVASDDVSKRRYAAALTEKSSKRRRKALPTLICTAGLAASLVVHQFTRYLRGLAVDEDVTFDPLAGRYEVSGRKRA